jgi:EAL domain-containing protein (putative c-di-GMP-specific phosphodiesterase class I)
LPVDMLKIDRTFVNGLTTSGPGRTVAQTIIALGKAFDMTTVAEGVETPEQFDILEHLGCDQSQGYLHSRPLSVSDIEPMLRAETAVPVKPQGPGHGRDVTSIAHRG